MKYRHHGYRDDDYHRERERDRDKPQKRGPREIATREATVVIRCWQCGNHQEPDAGNGPLAACSHCNADLHCCRNCRQFDPGARFQCRKPIEKAYRDKTIRHDCAVFEARQVLDSTGRRAGSGPNRNGNGNNQDDSSRNSNDPRDAFHNLFK